jgi:Type IV secretion system pilin
MFFQPKVQTVGSISDFLKKDEFMDVKKVIKKFNEKADAHGFKASLTTLATGATAISITNKLFTSHAYAQGPVEYVKQTAKEKIVEAFMPLVDLIQALSYPIALVMLTGGALMFMINQKDKGISLIQNASIGYILVQLMPLMMQLLVGIGNTVR